MDGRLVFAEARSRCAEGVLHSGKSSRWVRGRELRLLSAEYQDSTQGAQRRLASLRSQLLPPLSSRRASCRADRHLGKPCRLQVHHEKEDHVMSNDKIPEKPEMSAEPTGGGLKRRDLLLSGSSLVAVSALSAAGLTSTAQAQQPATAPAAAGPRPNIVVIMGDDIGMWNIGAYHRGMMAGRTPNLEKIAKEGMVFITYYAKASCTAGRANFITGELPIRTGMTTVGQAGASIGIPAEA